MVPVSALHSAARLQRRTAGVSHWKTEFPGRDVVLGFYFLYNCCFFFLAFNFRQGFTNEKSRSADKVAFPFMGFTSPKSEHKYPVYWRFVRADAFIRPLQDKSSVAQRFHTKDERSRLPKSGKTRLNTFSPVVVFTQMK